MTKNKLRNCIFLTTLLIISAIMFFGFQIKEVKAAPAPIYIPEENSKNNWHWDGELKDGSEYIYETTFIVQNKSSNEYLIYVKFYFIFNISISNQTYYWEGDQPCEFSIINATERYYNCSTDDTEPYDMDTKIIGGFQYNATEKEERIVASDRILVPFFLPINTSLTNDIVELASIIDESIYEAYYDYGMANHGFGFINDWNSITFPATNTMRFENTSDNYHAEFKYYNNGTLEKGDLYAEILYGPASIENLAIVNLTLNRIFDPNPINEVQWGVEEGDIIYYGYNYGDNNDDTHYKDTYWNITRIVNITTDVIEGFCFSFLTEEIAAYGTYQLVMVNCYEWNSLNKQYEFDEGGEYGVANEYMPYVGEFGGYILPNNTNTEDLIFSTIQWSKFEGEEVYGGNLQFSLVDEDNFYKTTTSMGGGVFIWDVWYEKNTGLVYLWQLDITDPGDLYWERIYIKENHTLETSNIIEINTDLLNGINATAKITTNGSASDFILGLLPISPVNETIPSGTPFGYIDWLITNISAITQLNITFKIPAELDLDNLNIQLWSWDDDEFEWVALTDLSKYILCNYTENTITLTIPSDEIDYLMEVMAALTYTPKTPSGGDGDDDDDDEKATAAVPGFDPYLLFAGIALFSLFLIFERKRKLKL